MENNQTLKELNACAILCNICYTNCLMDKEGLMARCIQLTRECAEACQIAQTMFSIGSDLTAKYLGLCAEASQRCAEECDKSNMDHCQKCAHVCRTCAQMCLTYQA